MVVSEIMVYYKITSENFNDNNFWIKFVTDIRKQLSSQQSLDNKILVVRLQDIIHETNELIPKLEYKK